jgi:hypothetical protein
VPSAGTSHKNPKDKNNPKKGTEKKHIKISRLARGSCTIKNKISDAFYMHEGEYIA